MLQHKNSKNKFEPFFETRLLLNKKKKINPKITA